MTRVRCRVCRRSCAQTRRGLVWWHGARGVLARVYGDPDPERYPRCPGSGEPPLGQPGPEVEPLPGQRLDWSHLADRGGSGTVYLLHLDPPYKHAAHYLGWASAGNLGHRLAHHGTYGGANLLLHAAKAGGTWRLTRTWPGDRYLERRIKRRGGLRRCCPICRPELEERAILEGVDS